MDWIAAGFDPGAFWSQTPRSLQRVFKGAARRRSAALYDATLAAWIGENLDHEGLRDFLAGLDDRPKPPLPPEAQRHALESMARSMAVISMDDYRARLRGEA
ncbi:hypothetical protein JI664_03530 [Rhodobacter sp. NTK016B]|uniref:hypothetical protein n=1 Tax=Rhodobacter sp. NTK016B TaxID=2759676 RepID=UPI001A8FB50C|nr:hypothetical protein [Rhodobacter sp. NTK016B]MBN8291028.1 hypothetical protein [Rhodobacter sp. NTK016B]